MNETNEQQVEHQKETAVELQEVAAPVAETQDEDVKEAPQEEIQEEPAAPEASEEPETPEEPQAPEVSEAPEAQAEPQHYETKEQVVERLRAIQDENDGGDKNELDYLKQVFYRLHKAAQLAARNAFVENGGNPEEWKVEVDVAEENFKAIMASIRQRRAQIAEALEAMKQENLQKKQDIIERIKEFVASPEEASSHYDEFKQLQAEWREIKSVPAEKATEIWKTFQLYVEQFYDQLKLNAEAREYDFRKNLEAKEHLCEDAEALNLEEDVVVAFNKLQRLHAEYKEIGPVAKDLREQIWERFKAASTVINKRHQEHFERIKAEEEANLQHKAELCERVEDIHLDEATTYAAWDALTKIVLEAQAEWKTVGYASHRQNNIIFDRFRAACDRFFTAKAEFFRTIKDEQNENLEAKRKLVEEAEALQNSTEWRKTSDKFVELQKRWKAIGAVPRKYSEALWKRFSEAGDKFFAAKSEATAGQREEERANLEAKRGVIAQLKAVLEDASSATVDAVRELQEKWNEIGHVPFRDKDKVYKEYRAVCDELYKIFGETQMRRRVEGFQKSIHRAVEQGQSTLAKERERLLRIFEIRKSEIQTYENNLNFLSAKSKSGNSLVEEMNRKVEKLREELNVVAQQLKALEQEMREQNAAKEE